jgi:1-acyl-sn-glycerol-3-phosphate acyltransferase
MTAGEKTRGSGSKPSGAAPPLRGPLRARRTGQVVLRPWWKVTTHGTENVPKTGPLIIAGNHSGFIDGPLIVTYSPRPVHFLIKQEMFAGPLDPLLHWFGHIPVDRAGTDRGAVLSSLAALAQGGVLGVFPEGTRSAEDFETMNNGVAYFALRSGAPVVPVACLGTSSRQSHIGDLPRLRARLDLVYGKPIELGHGVGRRAVEAASGRLRDALREHLAAARELTGR